MKDLSRTALALLVLCSCAVEPPKSQVAAAAPPAEIDGRFETTAGSLYLHCIGSGSPTVILEAGYGDDSTTWELVQPKIASLTRVCAYDRAGRGKSDASRHAEKSSSARIAATLAELLSAAHIDDRLVLVGHSLGGLHVRVFWSQHRSDVVGMVLVESFHEDIVRRFRDYVAPEHYQWWIQQFPSDVENFDLQASMAQARDTGSLGALPLVVLTSADAAPPDDLPPGAPEGFSFAPLRRAVAETQANLSHLSTRGRQIVIHGAGHDLHRDRPQAVVDAIISVVTLGRGVQ